MIMVNDSYNIQVAEGGFIVHVNKAADQPLESSAVGGSYTPRVFGDSAALLNFLHNELVGSN